MSTQGHSCPRTPTKPLREGRKSPMWEAPTWPPIHCNLQRWSWVPSTTAMTWDRYSLTCLYPEELAAEAGYQFTDTHVNPGPTYKGIWMPRSCLQDDLPLENFESWGSWGYIQIPQDPFALRSCRATHHCPTSHMDAKKLSTMTDSWPFQGRKVILGQWLSAQEEPSQSSRMERSFTKQPHEGQTQLCPAAGLGAH